MPDLEQNDNTWTVILYQSMSGDSQVGQGTFTMDGGKLISRNGGIFYTTNTESVFVIRNVEIEQSEDSEYFLDDSLVQPQSAQILDDSSGICRTAARLVWTSNRIMLTNKTVTSSQNSSA